MERKDVDEMSFAFRVKQQRWAGNNDELRYLDEVSLHKGDVSIVSFGANPHTSAALRSAFQAYARGELDERQIAELRALLRAGGGLEDGNDDDGSGYGGSLAQAVHDLCADAGAECAGMTNSRSRRGRGSYGSRRGNLSVSEAESLTGAGNLRVSEAVRIIGPMNLTLREADMVVSGREPAARRRSSHNLSTEDAELLSGRLGNTRISEAKPATRRPGRRSGNLTLAEASLMCGR